MSEDGAGKTRRGWPKIWRAHSDGTESEKVDGANECPAQPYGDSKSPLEVDNMDHPAPVWGHEAASEPLLERGHEAAAPHFESGTNLQVIPEDSEVYTWCKYLDDPWGPEAETRTRVEEWRLESLDAILLPQILICLHILGFLPVNEVLKYNLRAVSKSFSSREVWMMHLFKLVDVGSFQPLSDVLPAPWHRIDEMTACLQVFAQCTEMSPRKRFLPPAVLQFRAEASEAFQGCFHSLCGPWQWTEDLQGKYLKHLDLIKATVNARALFLEDNMQHG